MEKKTKKGMRAAAVVAVLAGLCARVAQAGQYQTSDGFFSLNWVVSGNVITFEASARTSGYVSVGFGPERSDFHDGGDCLTAWVDGNGQSFQMDGYSPDERLPRYDSSQDYNLISATQVGSQTTIRFSRALTINRPRQDFDILNERIKIFWAVGPDGDFSRLSYPKHSRYSAFTENLVATGNPPPVASPVFSPVFSPVASPVFSPVSSPVVNPVASPIPGGGGGGGGTGGSPSSSSLQYTSPQGEFQLGWELDASKTTLRFRAIGQTFGYVSVGFASYNRLFHSGGDCLTVWIPDGGGDAESLDGYSTSQTKPVTDSSGLYVVESATQVNGVTTVVFSRPVSAPDLEEQDFDIPNEPVTVFWAMGPDDGSGDFYGYHGPDGYGSFNVNLLDPNAGFLDGVRLDPGLGLLLSVGVPFAALGLFKWLQECYKHTLRSYKVEERAPVHQAKWFARVTSRLRDLRQSARFVSHLPTSGRQVGAYGPPGSVKTIRSTYGPKSKGGGCCVSVRRLLRERLNDEFTMKEALLLLLFVLLSISWVYAFPPAGFEHDPGLSWGYLSCACAMLSVVPAMRNSLFNLFLRQPFERAVLYHRWLGRFTFLSGLVHSLYYVVKWAREGTLEASMQVPKYRDGMLSMIFLSVLFFSSLEGVRRLAYNLFHTLHYSFIAFFLLGIMHTASTGVFLRYALGASVLYGIELFMRYGLGGFFPRRALSADVLPGDVLRVRFKKNPCTTYHAGQYVFLSFPDVSLFQWHPYTLSSAPGQPFLEVHIKALGDHTNALLRKVRSGPRIAPMLRVDGPYGRLAFDYRRFESLLFVGAGIGATPLVSIIKEIYQVGVPDELRTPYPLSPYIRNVYLVWVVPNSQAWSWFFDPILEALKTAEQPGMPSLRIEGYVTKPDPGFEKLKKFIKHKTSRFHVASGRPNITSVVERVEQCIGPGQKRIGTLTCGPKKLVNSVWDECNRRSNAQVSYDCHKEVFEF